MPTTAEAGAPQLPVESWTAVMAPASTPEAMVAKLSAEVLKIMATPDMDERGRAQGFRADARDPRSRVQLPGLRRQGSKPAALTAGPARAARTGFVSNGAAMQAWEQASLVARILHDMGEPSQALAEAEALLAEVAQGGGWGECVDAAFHLHRVLAPSGDARASSLLAAAYQGLNA